MCHVSLLDMLDCQPLRYPETAWYFMIDDDTLVFSENIVWALTHLPKYVQRQPLRAPLCTCTTPQSLWEILVRRARQRMEGKEGISRQHGLRWRRRACLEQAVPPVGQTLARRRCGCCRQHAALGVLHARRRRWNGVSLSERGRPCRWGRHGAHRLLWFPPVRYCGHRRYTLATAKLVPELPARL